MRTTRTLLVRQPHFSRLAAGRRLRLEVTNAKHHHFRPDVDVQIAARLYALLTSVQERPRRTAATAPVCHISQVGHAELLPYSRHRWFLLFLKKHFFPVNSDLRIFRVKTQWGLRNFRGTHGIGMVAA